MERSIFFLTCSNPTLNFKCKNDEVNAHPRKLSMYHCIFIHITLYISSYKTWLAFGYLLMKAQRIYDLHPLPHELNYIIYL